MKKQLQAIVWNVLFVFLFTQVTNGQRYTITPDSKNPGRKIITLEPVRQKAPSVLSLKNILDAEASYKRPPIPFKPFEMVYPKSRKPINPDAKITFKLKNGQQRVVTAKQFFDELNELERQLSLRGHSLRLKDAFRGMRIAPISNIPANSLPVMNAGFVNKSIKFNKPIDNNTDKPNKTFTPIIPTQPITTGSVDLKNLTLTNWEAGLYIAETTPGFGTVEFPVVWVPSSLANPGRKTFPLLIQVPKGFEKLVAKADWQVSETAFEYAMNNSKLLVSGSSPSLNWNNSYTGINQLKDNHKYNYTSVIVNMASIPDPSPGSKAYYARVALYNATGEIIKYSHTVGLVYGGKNEEIYLPIVQNNTVPEYKYSFPSNPDIPFGLFVRGGGIHSKKIEQPGKGFITPVGYKIYADAILGFRYYNFMNLVDNAQPKSKELNVIKATFTAIAGKQTSNNSQDETEGVHLQVEALDGLFKEKIPLVDKLPNAGISLNYTVKQSLDKEILNHRFMIGPVPIKIAAGFGGEAGLEMSGTADLVQPNVSGSIRPYLTTTFTAAGGVYAVIAYAPLTADIDPLLGIELPISFDSNNSDGLSFNGSIKGLYGKVYLKVGFYYPCPDLEKIVGWLSGDEDIPLCECNWEYNIFEFDGYEHTWGTNKK